MPARLFAGVARILLTWVLGVGLATAQTPPDSLTIKLPDNLEMRFRAIYLGIYDDNLFASRQIQLGAREQDRGYKEALVETLLGGSFVGRRGGKPDWLYYLGVSEVERRQFNAVLRWYDESRTRQDNKKRTQRERDDSRLPKTGVTVAEIQEFIEGLNTWILTAQRDQIPEYMGSPAFCRLPTEAEWEFAARGGIEVLETDPDRFGRRYPYDNLDQHEWYKDNSNNEAQECASQYIEPNQVGLYDILGNVKELTLSLFGPEYQMGRFGQLVIRGGDIGTSKDDLRVSMREEYAAHDPQGKLWRRERVGFRLALSTRISAARGTDEDFANALHRHWGVRALTRPGPVGKSSPADQSSQDAQAAAVDQTAKLQADKDRLGEEIARLEQEMREAQEHIQEEREHNSALLDKQSGMKSRMEELERSLAGRPSGEELRGLEERVRNLDAEKQGLLEQVETLERELRNVKEGSDREDSDRRRLQEELARAERETAELKSRSASLTDPSALGDLKDELARSESDNDALKDQLARLEQRLQDERQRNLGSRREIGELYEKLARRDQEIADLGRRQMSFDHEIDKNSGRVVAVEMRYLEALMRTASFNASTAWTKLSKLEAYWKRFGRGEMNDAQRRAYEDAFRMVQNYWADVEQIATKTRLELFSKVKADLAEELRIKEQKGIIGPIQRKALNLIETHVADVRARRYRRPEDLVESFTKQPEFQ